MSKKKGMTILTIILVLVCSLTLFTGCTTAQTVTHNIQKESDYFNVYRKMTFVNLYTNEVLYGAEGYFSVQTTYDNSYQGQQEVGLVFKIGPDEYKMDYFSIANNVTYVIEQLENTTTNPYFWKITWYIPLPDVEVM